MGIKIDIKPTDLKILLGLLQKYLPNTLVRAFGSRVKFTANPNSDLDLVAFITENQKISFSLLKEAVAESNLLFKVDLHNWNDLPENFKKNIEQQYVVVQQTETKENSLPKGWKTYRLDELCLKVTDGSHFSPKEDLSGEKLIASVKDMNNNGIDFQKCKKITKADFDTLVKNDCQPLKGDVLFSKDGTMGIVYYCKEKLDLVLLSSIAILRPNNKVIDGNYLAYYLKNPQTNQDIQDNFKSGSALPRIVLKDFKKLDITIPEDKTTQASIAQILTSLDDKIELNLQMNQTLEAMAQALFKEWFVNFNFPNFDGELVNGLPKGWKECAMRDFGKIICGKTPSKAVDEYFGGEYMFIKIPDMHNSVFIIETTDSLTELGLNSQSNKTIPPYSICISSIATVGLVCINPEPCQTNQQINTIVPKNSFLKYYLYFLAISMKETFLATASGGTATLNMNTSQFSNLSAIMPSDDILKEFDEIVSPMMAKILENNYCNQALTQTRDTLLPKLMSGKIEMV